MGDIRAGHTAGNRAILGGCADAAPNTRERYFRPKLRYKAPDTARIAFAWIRKPEE
jgi:hypothetical protein